MLFLIPVVCCRTAGLSLSATWMKQMKLLSLKSHKLILATLQWMLHQCLCQQLECQSFSSQKTTGNSIQKGVHDAQAMKACFEKRTGYFDLYNLTIYLFFTVKLFSTEHRYHLTDDTLQWLSRICSSVNVRVYNINKSNKYYCTGFES